MFQSRNRVSYPFKKIADPSVNALEIGFNLVIEYLILSSTPVGSSEKGNPMFQSRNRVSYPFKEKSDNKNQPKTHVSIS